MSFAGRHVGPFQTPLPFVAISPPHVVKLGRFFLGQVIGTSPNISSVFAYKPPSGFVLRKSDCFPLSNQLHPPPPFTRLSFFSSSPRSHFPQISQKFVDHCAFPALLVFRFDLIDWLRRVFPFRTVLRIRVSLTDYFIFNPNGLVTTARVRLPLPPPVIFQLIPALAPASLPPFLFFCVLAPSHFPCTVLLLFVFFQSSSFCPPFPFFAAVPPLFLTFFCESFKPPRHCTCPVFQRSGLHIYPYPFCFPLTSLFAVH